MGTGQPGGICIVLRKSDIILAVGASGGTTHLWAAVPRCATDLVLEYIYFLMSEEVVTMEILQVLCTCALYPFC